MLILKGVTFMVTDIEIRHRERDLLFRALKLQKQGQLEDIIAELKAGMDSEYIELVSQRIQEWEEKK
jgi:hypothetical protein